MRSNRNVLTMKYPASWPGARWREALPSGNGMTGAAVYGGVSEETVLLNRADLWHEGKAGELPDVGALLPEIRRRMREGDYGTAKMMLTEELAGRGYESRREMPLPLGDLKLRTSVPDGFRRYRRTLDMETGEVVVRWASGAAVYERALFVSRRDDAVVCELRAYGGTVEAELGLAPHDTEGSPSAIPSYVASSAETKAVSGWLYYAAANEDGRDFGAVLRIVTDGGKVDRADGTNRIAGTNRALLLLKTFAHGARERDWPRLARELADVAHTYGELLERHAALHRPLFRSAEIRLGAEDDAGKTNEELLLDAYEGDGLPAELAEKLWAYGRYLFVSATRPDGRPCPLYGLWGGGYRLMWSHFMANENVQMMYWHACVGGLTELAPSLFAHYEALLDVFRDNARRLYGCRGIFIPAGTTPNVGTPFQTVPVILYWTGAAGWLAQHMYEYWLFTGDRAFLRDRALPFMREAARFYQDFFEIGEDGLYVSYPSVSPENTPGNHYPRGRKPLAHPMPAAVNATLDFAIAKELLTNLIAGCREAGADEAEIRQWEEMLQRIPPYAVNADGAVKEWMHPDFEDNYRHRHISHLYPVFPGREISKRSDPALFQAFAEAVRRRLMFGLADQTAWSLAHLANLYARMEEGDRALECLELLARSCLLANLYTVHNDWRGMGVTLSNSRAPVQLDANMGWVSAVQEMLLYVSPERVGMLPALPSAWKRGEAKGLRYCAGTVAMSWDVEQGRFEAVLRAERDAEPEVAFPARIGRCRWRLEQPDGACAEGETDGLWQGRLVSGAVLRIWRPDAVSGAREDKGASA